MNIKEALEQLDTFEDSHWTSDGAPAISVVSEILGERVTRKEITDIAPKFSRQNMDLSSLDEEVSNPDSEEVSEDESEVDISALEDLSEEDPMYPNDLAEKYLKKIDPRLLPEVETILATQLQVIEEKEKEVEEMKRKVKLCKALTQTWIKQLVPDMSNQEAIQAYIRASQANRAKKTEEIRQVLGGLKPEQIAKLDPRAAIDRAFARKTGRGGQRPVR
jgi:hypothetical protein